MRILVLQTLAVQRRPAGGGPKEESLGANIPGKPHQIPDPLEAEHRIIDVERHHVAVVRGIGGACGHNRCHGTGLGNALLQNLAILRLVIEQQGLDVHWLIELAFGGVNPDLSEQGIQTEGPRLIRNDRNDLSPDLFIPDQQADDPHKAHGGRNLELP